LRGRDYSRDTVEVDFDRVQRQNITITTREQISQVRRNPPLHLKPLEQPGTLQYQCDFCQPGRLGGLLDGSPFSVSAGPQAGVMLFSEHSNQPFMVTWKRLAVTSTEERAECDVWFLTNVDRHEYLSYLADPAAAIQKEQIQREIMSDVPAFFHQNPAYKIATRAEQAETSTMHENLLVTVSLIKHVLDRDIRQLVIQIFNVVEDVKGEAASQGNRPQTPARDPLSIARSIATERVNSGRRFAQWVIKAS
jgi:hypothetical protein